MLPPSDHKVQSGTLQEGADAGVLPAVPVQQAPHQPDRHGANALGRNPDREQQPRPPLRRGLQDDEAGN